MHFVEFYYFQDLARYKSTIPQLVNISARQDTFVRNVFDKLKGQPMDEEEIALLRNIHQLPIPGHLGRGYSILSKKSKTYKNI